MEKSVIVHDITKEYNGRTVVDHLSFEVKKGQVFGLLGHNGAGKSTTIDCLLGLTKPEGGYAQIMGLNAAEHRKVLFEKVGVQLQQTGYQNNIRVGEICEEIAYLYKCPQDYHQLLHQFQLDGMIKQGVDKLSGGERQKLSVILALLPNPDILFLDELTTGLDVAARREVWHILKDLKQAGMTIFLTTHYMEEAQNLCDHIVILKAGKKVCEGSVEEIIQSSPYHTLEEAYLWYADEGSLL